MPSSGRIGAFLIVLSLYVAHPAHGQQFQGTLHVRSAVLADEALAALHVTDPDQLLALSVDSLFAATGGGVEVHRYTYDLKPGKLAMRPTGGGPEAQYMLVDLEGGVMRMVIPQMSAYAEWSFNARDSTGASGAEGSAAGPTVTPLGKRQTVNGMPCSLYRAQASDEVAVACIAAGYRDVSDAMRAMARGMSDMAGGDQAGQVDLLDSLGRYGFPVRVQDVSLTDGRPTQFEVDDVVTVERKTLADSTFRPPAGYLKMTLQDLLRGH